MRQGIRDVHCRMLYARIPALNENKTQYMEKLLNNTAMSQTG